ncbi:hypothetical protein EZI54_07125 [Marinobacter halodurans]|uniref:Uncharacterized protein n=1 Tax=Marinobacter halodurans TaxID=2528979 RepID=A0ABY1ZM94_9GAMM|nr:hypothetical protein [Marinobacter halodurans]TBW57423.1 hypothetical protein EZI54_07125 [Marinobacter halodurans]
MSGPRHLTFTLHDYAAEDATYVASLTDDATGDTILQFNNLDILSEPVREALAEPYKNHKSAAQDAPFLQGVVNLLDPREIIGGLQSREIVGPGDHVRVSDGRFGYFINLDERGAFSADVRDLSGYTVFSYDSMEQVAEDIDAGFIKHAKDLSGIGEMLVSHGLIPESAELLSMTDQESREAELRQEGNTLFEVASMRNFIFGQADNFDNESLRLEIDEAAPTIIIEDELDPDQSVVLEGEDAAAFMAHADCDALHAVIDRMASYKSHAIDVLADHLSHNPSPTMG